VDVVYAILPPLPLGVSAWAIAKVSGARLVVNIQDIYPDIAVALNFLTNKKAVAFFRRMERWIYRRADRIVVISEGFRENLLGKGVDSGKLRVVSNWADPDQIVPGPRENAFRRELGTNGDLLVLYSGGLTHNSDLEPVLDAAAQLRGLPVRFAIVGDGVHKQVLVNRAAAAGLDNVAFFPFQPIERYGEVLAAADVTLVALNSAATFASVPSKIYKQMAAARPIIAITNPGNELSRLIADAQCGVTVRPADSEGIADLLRSALAQRDEFAVMGLRGRAYLERNCSRNGCIDGIEAILADACKAPPSGAEGARGPLILEPAVSGDIAAIVELHKLSFPQFFMTALGDRFLAAYYRTVLAYPGRIFYVVRQDRAVAGFAAGFVSPANFYSLLHSRRVELAIDAGWGLLHNPKLLVRLVRGALRVRSSARASDYDCELSSIGVHPDLAGHGIGKLLLGRFISEAAGRDVKTIVLSTDARKNEHVNLFYRNRGFTVTRVYFSGKREMNEYVLNIGEMLHHEPQVSNAFERIM
jgi:colanic acid biosynthesis glycosyl transferase WcaI